jgi:transposase
VKGPNRNSGSRPIIKDLVNALFVEANKKITMNQKYFIGIDVSKEKLDCALILSDYKVVTECIIPNNRKKIKSFLKGVLKGRKIQADQLVVCCETTGVYTVPLRKICIELNIGLWEEHAYRIKKASSDMRGKSDRKDAMRIADYSVRYQDKMVPYKEPSDVIRALDQLAKVRDTFITQKVAMENQLNETESHDPETFKALSKHFKPMIAHIESQLKKIDLEIQDLLNQNEDIQQNIELMKGIPGVGKQTALQFVIYTHNFTLFESAKHLACYAGVVPFQNESGTVVKRPRISKMASQKLKSLLHLAAMSAVRSKSELKAYYIRKVAEGKNKMSVLNAVRNKIVHRIWAVIERQSPFLPQENFRPI